MKYSKAKKRRRSTVLRAGDKLAILGFTGVMILGVASGMWLRKAESDPKFARKFHLKSAQMKQVTALNEEHNRIYGELKKRADERREKLEAVEIGKRDHAAVSALLAEIDALHEDLWQEELRYKRAVALQMTEAYARVYLAPVERNFAERKRDARGFLTIPHK